MPSYTHPFTIFRFLLLPAVIAFLYLYFYPAINDCAFPPATRARSKCSLTGDCKNTTVNAGLAPFRLLALADPQLEGDTSLPAGWNNGASAGLRKIWGNARSRDWDGLKEDLPVLVKGYRKRLDLWGNDRYLKHVYGQTRWWSMPTHTVVLGDLLGSQWIGDEEFERRAERFWGTVFGEGERVPEEVMNGEEKEREVEILGENERTWRRRVIAVAGNHDVGYAGDLTEARIERFERAFGKVNWEMRFRLPNATLQVDQEFASKKTPDFYDGPGAQPELRLVILNSMNLDEPAYSPALREESLKFMDEHICNPEQDHEHSATVLLTHIPFHKASGICVDGPFFSHFPPENGAGIREQNHLSEHLSRQMSHCLTAGTSIVLNGHDHEGCDTRHYTSLEGETIIPKAIRSSDFDTLSAEEKLNSFREITVRSMMGSYGGYAGFLSGWFNQDEGKWEFEYATCGFGVQHIWWACNIVLLVELGLGVMSASDALAQKFFEPERREKLKEA